MFRFMAYGKSNGNYVFFQPNTHKDGDCVIRACVKATGKTWYQVYDALCEIGRKLQRMPNDRKCVDIFLKELGFSWWPLKAVKGESRPIVRDFAKYAVNNGPCVCSLSHHMVCCEGGNYYDIWDSGDCAVYGWWGK